MIVCSCNLICTNKIKACLKGRTRRPSVSMVLKELGCSSVCGTCMSNIVKEIKEHYHGNQKETNNE